MGGIVGGGTLVPLIRLIFNFGTAQAIALSNVSVGTGAVVSFILNFNKPHPFKKDLDGKPAGLLLDYNLTIIMMPMGVVGSAIGAIIPAVVAEPILILILVLLLIFVTFVSAKKLLAMC